MGERLKQKMKGIQKRILGESQNKDEESLVKRE